MFPWIVPFGIGIALLMASAEQRRRSSGRISWVLAGVVQIGAMLLWWPALILFPFASHFWPHDQSGSSGTYSSLMSWQVAWIVLGIPLGLLLAAGGLMAGERRRKQRAGRRVEV